MKIAFMGKGGSGKTTLCALFCQRAAECMRPLLAIDADINMHLSHVLGIDSSRTPQISHRDSSKKIKEYLRGTNARIESLESFRKTTPPGRGSVIVQLKDILHTPISQFIRHEGEIFLMNVGTYTEEDIGASCYHNNLAILEIFLSHLADGKGAVAADMVAGTDAFAGTLHAQFDIIFLVVEPTRKGVEVYEQFAKLASSAGTFDSFFAVGNKVRSQTDEEFLKNNIPQDKLIALVKESEIIRKAEQEDEKISPDVLEGHVKAALDIILKKANETTPNPTKRLQKLHEIHRKYSRQTSILERFGDLTKQIDPAFNYQEHAQ